MAKSQISSMWPTWWVCNSAHYITRHIERTVEHCFLFLPSLRKHWRKDLVIFLFFGQVWSLKPSPRTKIMWVNCCREKSCISKCTQTFFINEAYCGDASGNHITINPIIRVRNTYPGIMAVVKHHLKLGARCMTKQTMTRLDITHIMTSICRFSFTCVIETKLKSYTWIKDYQISNATQPHSSRKKQ